MRSRPPVRSAVLPAWSRTAAVAVALAVMAAVALFDALSPGVVLIPLLVIGPFMAASLAGVGGTAVTVVPALALAVALGWPDHFAGSGEHLVRVAGVVVGCALALWVARERELRLEALEEVARVAEVAQGAILRPVPGRVGDVAVATRYVSSAHRASLGGDVFEVVESPFVGEACVGVANCGHYPPIVVGGGGSAALEGSAHSLPLGLGASAVSQYFPFRPGDRLLCYTDGVVERRGAEDFPLRLAAARCLAPGRPLGDGLDCLLSELGGYHPAGPPDDIALLACEVVGRSG